MQAVMELYPVALESALAEASITLTQPVLISDLIVPLLNRIGDMWHSGRLRIMHEHMTTAVIRSFLSYLRNTYRSAADAPGVLVCTPVGQVHELGALIVAVIAASEPLLPILVPARSIASSRVSAVITPKITGNPVSKPIREVSLVT